MRVALITACYGAYDPVRDLPEGLGFDEAICVTDRADLVGKGWSAFVEPREEPPRLAAKRPKMLPWLFTDCDAALWIDASFEITSLALRSWTEKHLARDDFVVWSHPEGRICLSQEADVCWDFPKYKDQPIREQANFYLADGMPRGWGLFAAGAIGWRFTSEAKRFGAKWYREQERWTVQDQISLPYLLWSSGKRFGVWDGNEYDNPYVRLRWDERPNPQA
jgi:hypothetical protein